MLPVAPIFNFITIRRSHRSFNNVLRTRLALLLFQEDLAWWIDLATTTMLIADCGGVEEH
ncbi:hypothetical protein M758_9G030000 [Ceratodon purpureus]|nr:hypothetical protein M758_9G030000 [Ceratodon purpureus]